MLIINNCPSKLPGLNTFLEVILYQKKLASLDRARNEATVPGIRTEANQDERCRRSLRHRKVPAGGRTLPVPC